MPIPVPAPSPAPPKKKPSVQQMYALVWVSTHGPGKYRSWTGKNVLRVVGVYATKAAAEAEKERIIGENEECGDGDMMISGGGSWEDEITLIVKQTPVYL